MSVGGAVGEDRGCIVRSSTVLARRCSRMYTGGDVGDGRVRRRSRERSIGNGGVALRQVSRMKGKRRSHDRSDRSIVRVDFHNRLRLGIASFVVREVIDLLLPSQTEVLPTRTSDSFSGILGRDIEFDVSISTKIWLFASNDLITRVLDQKSCREQKKPENSPSSANSRHHLSPSRP